MFELFRTFGWSGLDLKHTSARTVEEMVTIMRGLKAKEELKVEPS